jgi:hypothetical protein
MIGFFLLPFALVAVTANHSIGSEAGSRERGNRQRLRSFSSASHWILISASQRFRISVFPPVGAQDRGRLEKGWRRKTLA